MKANDVADLVLSAFRALPNKAKPRRYPHGSREWTPLSGVVIAGKDDSNGRCVALGTGTRCLPAMKLQLARGKCLHDWHAEVIAIRALNHYLLQECRKLARDADATSEIIRWRDESEKSSSEPQQFALQNGLILALFSTEAPCGDASMELTMRAQADASPWMSPNKSRDDDMLRTGRGHFSDLGVVRRKPSRSDAPATLSKSCSDKLALKQCTSLLSSLTSLLIHPGNVYLDELIIPRDQLVDVAIERSFGSQGRMQGVPDLAKSWSNGYYYKPFNLISHDRLFEFQRPPQRSVELSQGSNIAAVWTPHLLEVLIGGTKQGHKQFSSRGASAVSRSGMWRLVSEVARLFAADTDIKVVSAGMEYSQLKASAMLAARRAVKKAVLDTTLSPWPRNEGDDFNLDYVENCD